MRFEFLKTSVKVAQQRAGLSWEEQRWFLTVCLRRFRVVNVSARLQLSQPQQTLSVGNANMTVLALTQTALSLSSYNQGHHVRTTKKGLWFVRSYQSARHNLGVLDCKQSGVGSGVGLEPAALCDH
ncbi:hypothetical protein ElyMa_004939000 [Elysia marginata]|uniref:Uncharacterized protein n=1 Tax=Elysia marginata TaxID=1093978 RepID=A0AAV4IYP9_9GAST|nr:hypothetical protein ElyMa_004939000 [Elysia marginata]